jgi:hypothetical protein
LIEKLVYNIASGSFEEVRLTEGSNTFYLDIPGGKRNCRERHYFHKILDRFYRCVADKQCECIIDRVPSFCLEITKPFPFDRIQFDSVVVLEEITGQIRFFFTSPATEVTIRRSCPILGGSRQCNEEVPCFMENPMVFYTTYSDKSSSCILS